MNTEPKYYADVIGTRSGRRVEYYAHLYVGKSLFDIRGQYKSDLASGSFLNGSSIIYVIDKVYAVQDFTDEFNALIEES